jgi:hypothetical protein
MSFREKIAWISLLSLLGVIAWYFWPFFQTGHMSSVLSFPRLAAVAVVIIILQTVVRIVVGVLTPRADKIPPDEREKMIELKGRQFSYVVLGWAVRLDCFFGVFNPALFFSANTLLFFLMMSEVAGIVHQIVQFRQGA